MKLIYLTFIAAVCSSPLLLSQGETSPWPRRPAVLEQARLLARDGRYADACDQLRSQLAHTGIAGTEIRSLYSALMMRLYMNREHPKAFVYTVQSGDHIQRIAEKTNCSPGLIMLINGILDPSRLRAGQKLVAIPLQLRLLIHEQESEIALWDGDILLASYPIKSVEGGVPPSQLTRIVKKVDAYRSGKKLSRNAALNISHDRVIEISGGIFIAGLQKISDAFVVYRLPQERLNEWAFFVLEDIPVRIISKGEFKLGEAPPDLRLSTPASVIPD